MKHLLPRGKRILVALILIWGVLALTARLATPLLEYAHDPLAEWLSERVGQPVAFERIEASWWGIGPRLRLSEVRIGSGEEALRLAGVSVDLSHVSLLKGQLLDALRLTLDGMQLQLIREPDRRIHLAGLPARQDSPAEGGSGNNSLPLPRRTRLRNTRLHWEDRVRDASPLVVENIDLDLVRNGKELDLRARLRNELGDLRFGARIQGFLAGEDWHGSSYLRVQGLELRAILDAYLPASYRLHSGQLDGELWQEWQQATEVSTLGSFAVRDLDVERQDTQAQRFRAHELSGDIDYLRRSDSEWRTVLDGLTLRTATGVQPPPGRIAVHRFVSNGQRRFEAAAEGLQLDALRDLALVLPLDPQLGEPLQELQPTGLLQNLRLSLTTGQAADWTVSAKLKDVSLQAWQQIPGIASVDLSFNGTPERASLQLAGRGATLDYRQLFRETHSLEQLLGQLHWQRQEQGWFLFGDDLQLSTPDLDFTARFEYLQRPGESGVLDLHGQLQNGDAGATDRYLPATIMNPKLVDWLDRSLSSGRLEQADVLVSGPLRSFPYHRERDGVFEVVGFTRDTPLDYQQGWPPLQDVNARLFFHQKSLDIDLLEGRIYSSKLINAKARIKSLGPTSPLRIRGRLVGPLEDQLKVLQEPALRDRFGHIAGALEASGQSTLDLDFQVPLAHGRGNYALDGTLRFANNRLSLKDWDLTIDRINGDLKIDLDAVRASGIRGIAFGQAVQVDVVPGKQGTRIQADTRWPVEVLRQRFPDLPLQLVSGEAEFALAVDLPHRDKAAEADPLIAVSSNLRGMQLALPAPLGKTTQEERSLRVEMPLGTSSGSIHIRYDEQLDARISMDGRRAGIRYASGTAQLPDRTGVVVRAKLPRLDVAEWQDLAEQFPAGEGGLPWQLELNTPQLNLYGLVLSDQALSIRSAKGEIEARMDGPNLAGTIGFRRGTQNLLSAHLERLHLELPKSQGPPAPPPDPANGPDPRTLPRIALRCDDLRINDAQLGKLALLMQPVRDGSRIQKASIKGPSGSLQANGEWLWRQQAAHSRIQGRLRSPDFGELLNDLGYPRQVENARTDLSFDLEWPGSPAQAHRATIVGSADLTVTDGRLSEVEPGITRVLGLLSLDAIQRRLKLDFNDLLKKGYSFDTIEGRFELSEGQAETRDLVIDGPSGRIEVGGRIGLVTHDFDQVVQVTPKLDATLVIASTIAGGPIAGAAAFLAQRLLSEEVDQINRFEYAVSGDWDDPTLTPLESGGLVSQILHGLSGKQSEAKTEAQEMAIDESLTRPQKGLLERVFGERNEQTGKSTIPDEGSFPGGN